MALSALLAGLLIGVRAQKRVAAFSKTLDAVSQGQINSRVDVVPAGGDDIDHIARKLNLTLDHLSSAMLSMQQVTVDIAHDLKSPIARLRNRLIDCIAHFESEQNAKKDLLEAIGDADQIAQTFDAMLRIAQIESGERRQHFESLDLAKVVDRAVEIYGAVVEDAGGRLSIIANEAHAGRVVGDEQLILQLLANLIENSVNHCSSPPQIILTIGAHPGGTALSVADNGPGIPAAERERVQERFYRLDKSRSSKGTGLGLALVAAIANLHGAKLNLSDNNPGLRATVDFPTNDRP
jgi:signal transduction histidine kinase